MSTVYLSCAMLLAVVTPDSQTCKMKGGRTGGEERQDDVGAMSSPADSVWSTSRMYDWIQTVAEQCIVRLME